MKIKIIISLILFLNSCYTYSNTINIPEEDKVTNISSNLLIYEDSTSLLSINDILNKPFKKHKQIVPNLGVSNSTFWIQMTIKNLSKLKHFILELSLPSLDYIEFYFPDSTDKYSVIEAGENLPFISRKYQDPNYLFDINIPQHETKVFYLKIISTEGIQLPIKIGPQNAIFNQIKNRDILSGLYFGIMLVMIFYNLFVFLAVKDKSYIYYVVYIILILLTQTSLQGYPFQYLWPNYPIINQYSLFILPALVGIAGMAFMNVFLKVNFYNRSLFKLSFLFATLYLIPIILVFLRNFELSQKLLQINAGLVSLFMLGTSIYIIKKGYKPAKYFLIAWGIFLIGVIIFILKDFEILPFNNFTRYTMQIGSAIETVLLSFALANKINIIQAEKEELIMNQNVILEQKVDERTTELNKTLKNLKETQSQLVDAEKMSSLGQLTAGIAHEINNPINFVSSNIPPLKQDIDDLKTIIKKYEEINSSSNINEKLNEINTLKQELDYEFLKTELNTIINGIETGAKRTAEIVKGLKTFSRLDENDLTLANINEGIESTLTILKSTSFDVDLLLNLNPLPEIECFPGKLNQVFLNVINNAIQATKENTTRPGKGKVEVTTLSEAKTIKILISDNGYGMTEETKAKIFEPFFTTKKIGEGTGLGLSIVYRIIENHKGKIEVNSIINRGTTFTITLPIKQQNI
ncbi:MAG: GHKL domain-containing protein [Flavobacteriales bacterium]|nr:GHKL domain-containing protein [Flavobacteriales bacterium]